MKSVISLVTIALCVALFATFAVAEDRQYSEDYPPMSGIYVGKVDVLNPTGHVIHSNVRLRVRKGKEKYYIVEMYYFDRNIAKFTKCERKGKYKLKIADKVDSKIGTIFIDGYINSKSGKVFHGKLSYDAIQKDGTRKVLRTFTLKNLKKKSSTQ